MLDNVLRTLLDNSIIIWKLLLGILEVEATGER